MTTVQMGTIQLQCTLSNARLSVSRAGNLGGHDAGPVGPGLKDGRLLPPRTSGSITTGPDISPRTPSAQHSSEIFLGVSQVPTSHDGVISFERFFSKDCF